jgi:type VI secretion system secreted protein VgrG
MTTRTLTTFFQAQPIETSDVVGFRVERRLGVVTEAEVEVRHGEYVDPDELLGRPAYLGFGRQAPEHGISGVVMDVEMDGTPEDDDERSVLYRIRITSWMGLLAREVDCRIFQDKDVKEIVAEVMRGAGIDDRYQVWRLAAAYPKRTYCVQYNESSLAFVSRLLEEEGIFFHAEAGEDGETIVFADDSMASEPIQGDKEVPYRFGAGLAGVEDAIGVITRRYRTATGKVVLRDYDFEKPKADLTATAAADEDADLEIYDYPGLYKEKNQGERLARVRLEALQCERAVIELESGCPRITAGRWLTLVDAPDDLDGDYFVIGAVHTLRDGVYLARATTIPKRVKYRSPQRTRAPVIEGPQTAVVVAPDGAPAEEIHTDKHGRCKVKFHWDRYGKNNDTASCWIRVTQPQTSGAIILPRVGWEVIVEFQEGNPDRPLVTGRLFNGKWMPPYALPEGKSRTALRTSSSPGGKGTNEIRLEDKAGSEEISIQSQKNTTVATANNKTRSTAVNESKNVKVDSKLTVGADQKVQVTNGYLNTVKGAQTTTVGANRTVEVNAVYGLTVKGASATSVSGNQMEMDGDPINALLSLAVKAATEAAKAEAERALQRLDQAVASKVNQVMGPVNALQSKVENLGGAMEAVSRGNLGATASAFGTAASLPSPSAFGASLREAMAPVAPAMSGHASSALGLDTLVNGAIDAGAAGLGQALGLDGGGGGGASGANMAGPDGAVAGNSGSDSATGPGHAINVCSARHDETIGSVKATIAAAGIHTTVKGARTQDVGAARVELVAGTRAETCLADKTEKALGLAVISGAPESETVGGSRTTMVGGAVVDKIGGSHTVVATGKGMFVGAFHKVDAAEAIVFKCGASEVVIDGGGITIQSPLVTITAPTVKEKGNVSQL